jgi:hypothetical protein
MDEIANGKNEKEIIENENVCMEKCKCCIRRNDGTIVCLNTYGCIYGFLSEPNAD